MSKHIVVFIKQVADNTKLKFNDAGPVFDGVPMMMNPYDEYALETAIRLKESAGAEATLTAITLGAASAKEILKKSIAVGVDAAFILSNDNIASDSNVTAHILHKALTSLVPNASVLVFGQTSLDELDGQTGLKVAELFNAPALTFCKSAEWQGDDLTVQKESVLGIETHTLNTSSAQPAVLCVSKCDYELRGSNIKGVMKANKTEIPIKTSSDIGINAEQLKPSTSIQKSWPRPTKSATKHIDGSNPESAVNSIIEELKLAQVL